MRDLAAAAYVAADAAGTARRDEEIPSWNMCSFCCSCYPGTAGSQGIVFFYSVTTHVRGMGVNGVKQDGEIRLRVIRDVYATA